MSGEQIDRLEDALDEIVNTCETTLERNGKCDLWYIVEEIHKTAHSALNESAVPVIGDDEDDINEQIIEFFEAFGGCLARRASEQVFEQAFREAANITGIDIHKFREKVSQLRDRGLLAERAKKLRLVWSRDDE